MTTRPRLPLLCPRLSSNAAVESVCAMWPALANRATQNIGRARKRAAQERGGCPIWVALLHARAALRREAWREQQQPEPPPAAPREPSWLLKQKDALPGAAPSLIVDTFMVGISSLNRACAPSTSKERFKTFLERPRSLTESHRVAHSHTLKLEIRCASDAYSGKDRREKSRASAAAMARAAERGARSSPRAPI